MNNTQPIKQILIIFALMCILTCFVLGVGILLNYISPKVEGKWYEVPVGLLCVFGSMTLGRLLPVIPPIKKRKKKYE